MSEVEFVGTSPDVDSILTKEEYDRKIRCANFLLDMIKKYGGEVNLEVEKEGIKY